MIVEIKELQVGVKNNDPQKHLINENELFPIIIYRTVDLLPQRFTKGLK